MSEWFKEIVLKTIVFLKIPWVRIPLYPKITGRDAVVACLFWEQEAAGSSPAVPIKKIINFYK